MNGIPVEAHPYYTMHGAQSKLYRTVHSLRIGHGVLLSVRPCTCGKGRGMRGWLQRLQMFVYHLTASSKPSKAVSSFPFNKTIKTKCDSASVLIL